MLKVIQLSGAGAEVGSLTKEPILLSNRVVNMYAIFIQPDLSSNEYALTMTRTRKHKTGG